MEKTTVLFAIIFTLILILEIVNIYIVYAYYKEATYEEKLAPSDYINENNILIGSKIEGFWTASDYYVLIPLNDEPFVSKLAPTGSMKPVFDENANTVEIVPKSENEIKVGDIISYKHNEDIIIHRVISVGEDEQGWFALTKGDNNAVKDNVKIRFPEITGKVILVIY